MRNMLAHDFRRTCARNMRARGISPDVAMKLMGWQTWSMWERYAIVDEGALKDAIGKLAAHGRLLPSMCPSDGAEAEKPLGVVGI